ncbi:Vacuolar protein sorting-associated protein ist1 [Collariella sp. IMI 366227]|nr:Vacuolar protein sorting-associated protein ist1 [Collariella sp. IMI 366227]
MPLPSTLVNIIRSDVITELHEMLELYCELLLARAGLLEVSSSGAGCDPGLEEAVKSLMYAAQRTEIKELHQVRALLAERFGKEFALQAVENSDGKVSERVVRKLNVQPPREELVQGYLEEIAKAYGDGKVDAREELVKATPPDTFGPPSPLHVVPPRPSTDNIHPKLTLNRVELTPTKKSAGAGTNVAKKPERKESISDGIPDVSELAKRFAALKR